MLINNRITYSLWGIYNTAKHFFASCIAASNCRYISLFFGMVVGYWRYQCIIAATFEAVTTLFVIVLLMLFSQRTLLGLAMRAASLDFMVRLSGVRANRVFLVHDLWATCWHSLCFHNGKERSSDPSWLILY